MGGDGTGGCNGFSCLDILLLLFFYVVVFVWEAGGVAFGAAVDCSVDFFVQLLLRRAAVFGRPGGETPRVFG